MMPPLKFFCLIFAALLLAPRATLQAGLGMDWVSYGVWNQEGFHSVTNRIETNLNPQQFIRLIIEMP